MQKSEKLQKKSVEELQAIIAFQTQQLNEKNNLLFEKEKQIHQKEKQISHQFQTIHLLKEQLKLSRFRQFGKSSEKHIEDHPQALLFDEAQLPSNETEIVVADEEITVASFKRKKKSKPGRKPLPAHLPRVERIYDIEENEKRCDCGCTRECVGDERSEQLGYKPAETYVIVHVRKKYACRKCEQGVKTAKLPHQPIPKSIASSELLAYIGVAKFEDYLPLYRLERILQRIGVDIPRCTLSLWVIRCAELLKPLYNLLLEQSQHYDVASIDETPVQVLNEPGREATTQSYMWVLGGGPMEKPVWLYHYAPTRSHRVLDDLLGHFTGYLHCDGYTGYDSFAAKQPGITQVGCWYHVRRYFKDAEKLCSKAGLANHVLRVIKQLAKIEDEGKKLTPEQRYHLRQRKAKPQLKSLKAWLMEHCVKVPPQSTLGKAFAYSLNQWPKLINYLKDGRLQFSNNHTERAVKPFVMGRKAWLFANSVAGAKAAAIIYSIIETCKANRIPTYEYLVFAFTHLPQCQTVEQIEKILPNNIDKTIFNQ